MSDQGRHMFTVGQRARIVQMPDSGQRLVGQLVTVGTMGGFSEPDDVFITTDDGVGVFVKAHQLAPLDGD